MPATPAQFLLSFRDHAWHIVTDGTASTPYASEAIALDAAIDMAELEGRAGRAAEVIIERGDTTDTLWVYGRNPYPPAR